MYKELSKLENALAFESEGFRSVAALHLLGARYSCERCRELQMRGAGGLANHVTIEKRLGLIRNDRVENVLVKEAATNSSPTFTEKKQTHDSAKENHF